VNKGDQLIERGADGLQELSRKARAKGGFVAKFADELAEDAEFLRKLKPSLIAARARNEPPKAERVGSEPMNEPVGWNSASEPVGSTSAFEPLGTSSPGTSSPGSSSRPESLDSTSPLEPAGGAPTHEPVTARLEAPSAPPLSAPRPSRPPKKKRQGGPNPFVVAGIALAAGIVLAKVIDWRGHAHPRD
jgi:hypothetical protein